MGAYTPEFARAFRYQPGEVVRHGLIERAIWPDTAEEEDCAGWTLTQDEYNEIVADYERQYLEHWEAHDG